MNTIYYIIIGLIIIIPMIFKVMREYERAVVFTFGRFTSVKGPGLIVIIPLVQQIERVELRTVVMDVPSQDVISRDNVSVKVNAVVYFRVIDPERAIIQVENFHVATSQLAQTTLRSVLGQHELDEMLAERNVVWAGLALMALGIIFMVAEVFAPSFGALGIGGIIAFVTGSVILFDTEGSEIHVAISIIAAVTIVSATFFLIVLRMVFAAHHKPIVSGVDEMLGSIGQVLEDFEGSGRIHIHGEAWQVESKLPLKRGDQVRVTSIDGLILSVEPVTEGAI